MKIKKLFLFFLLTLSLNVTHGQQIAVKTNVAYWATATLNIGGEVALGRKSSLDLTWGYNPWTWSDNKKWKHWLVMPEYRYWLCEAFNGHFFGLHAGYAEYNIGGISLPYYKDAKYYRYQGWAAGAGLSYGYQWILGKRWNLEATLGYGIVWTEYAKYLSSRCGPFLGDNFNWFTAPTKVGITLTYLIK